MSLELAAMRWLWLEQKCLVVLEERTPKYGMGQPDVLGVTPGRYLTEIEVKRSASDFRADFKKCHRMVRAEKNPRTGEAWEGMLAMVNHPRQFYYLMVESLAEKVKAEIPGWAGLMTLKNESWHTPEVVIRAPVNKDSAKLTVKQCARLARMMTAHMMGYAIGNNSIREQWRNNEQFHFVDWVDCEKGTYVI